MRTALVALALAAVALAAHGGSAGHAFLTYDDGDYVVDNPHVAGGLTAAGVAWAFTEFHSSNWHPLTWISHMVDVELFGLGRPGAHHLVSASLHALNAALCLLALVAATRALWPSALVAALFALHPLRVQSVAWISERKDLLAGAFFFLALLAHVRFARRGGAGRYALLVATVAAGLLAKPTLVSLPLVLLLLDAWPLRRPERVPWGRLVLEKLPLAALAALSATVTALAQRTGGALGSLADVPLAARVSNALVSYATYLGRTLWPSGLANFHPHPALVEDGWSPWNARAALAAALLLGLTVVALRTRRTRPHLLVGWLWYAIVLGPMIGIVQVGEQAWAERYAYLSAVGIYIALAWEAARLAAARPALRTPLVAGTAVALAACLVWTRARTEDWRDSESLYRRTLAVTERNYVAHAGLAKELHRQGDRAGARRQFEEALAIRPRFVPALYGLGLTHQEDEELDVAIELYEQALEEQPELRVARLNLGSVLAQRGEYGRARVELERVLAVAPEDPDARFNLALILALEERLVEARAELRRLLELHPGHTEARRLLAAVERELDPPDEMERDEPDREDG